MSQYYDTDHLRLPRQPKADDLAHVGGDSDPYGDLFERPDQTRQSSSSSSDAVPVFLPFPGNEKSYKRPPRQAVQQGKYWLKFILENVFLTRLSHKFYLQLQVSPSSPVNLSQCLFRSWVERSIILEYFSRWGQSHFLWILFSKFHLVILVGQLVQGGAVLQVPQHAPGQHQQRGGAARARGKKNI